MAKDVDVSKFVTSKREIVVFECPLSDASRVVDAVLHDSRYRSLMHACMHMHYIKNFEDTNYEVDC